jgi:uncharacterized protein (TIGR02444 family)
MTEELWPFSLRFYDDTVVQEACLELQDAHDGDVNVALCILWHSSRGALLSNADVAAIDAEIAPWRLAVVQPLRAIRRKLKTDKFISNAEVQQIFRKKVKAAELSAEKVEQTVLGAVRVTPIGTDHPGAAARHNLAAYGLSLGGAV